MDILNVRRVGNNNIIFYSDVSMESALEFNAILLGIITDMKCDSNIEPIITIHIYSHGGDYNAAVAMADMIRIYVEGGLQIDTIVEGTAASGASMMTLFATNKYITKHSNMLMHYSKNYYEGEYPIAEFVNNSKNIDKVIFDMYKSKLKVDDKKLHELLMTNQRNISAKECLRIGLVDKIL